MFELATYPTGVQQDISRRILLKRISYFISGIALFPQGIKASNEFNKSNNPKVDFDTFKSFVEVIVPDAGKYSPFLANEILDEFYGFSKYFDYLIKILDANSMELYAASFSQLSLENKRNIILEGTQQGIFRKQIFNGAIYLLQLIVFSGLCEKNQSCDIIDFPGVQQRLFQSYNESGIDQLNSVGINGNPI